MASSIPRGDHITGIHLKISPEGLLRAGSAGNPPCAITPANGEDIRLFTSGGQALGMFPKERVAYLDETYDLRSGDKIVLFTDGIPEWKNRVQRPFGMERLLKCLDQNREKDVGGLLSNLLEGTRNFNFARGVPSEDDLTILGFRFLGKPT
ncbi:MAG: serine/threonine-protein phosphatase [Proteobacteria bacterium]|nr:serine/threonine-protein phosphatase [Pseudomonadota bacterium]